MGGTQIGRVTEGGKIHAMVHGTTRCPVLATRRIVTTVRPSAVQPETACKHCTRPPNLLRIEQANARVWVPAIDAMLDRLASPEAKQRSAELVARWNTPVVRPLVELVPVWTTANAHIVRKQDPTRRLSPAKRLALHKLFAPTAA